MTAKVILKSTYRISSNKRPQRPPPYPNFETVKGGAYQRALIRGRCLFQSLGNEQYKMSKPCHFFFQNKKDITFHYESAKCNEKSKYQQYFHCILVPYEFWFSCQQNIVAILISPVFISAALIRWEALIIGRHLFQFR